MADPKPTWWFHGSPEGYWVWRTANSAASMPLRSLEDATVDAARFGFAPLVHYWTATNNGLTTHFRPGKTAFTLPYDEYPEPPA